MGTYNCLQSQSLTVLIAILTKSHDPPSETLFALGGSWDLLTSETLNPKPKKRPPGREGHSPCTAALTGTEGNAVTLEGFLEHHGG